jgi:hypothetical protein
VLYSSSRATDGKVFSPRLTRRKTASGGVLLSGGQFMDAKHPQAVGARAIAFVDGQNLFYAAKDAFGYEYPNYDVLKLARRVSADKGWVLT